jgi:hypothetical protein
MVVIDGATCSQNAPVGVAGMFAQRNRGISEKGSDDGPSKFGSLPGQFMSKNN